MEIAVDPPIRRFLRLQNPSQFIETGAKTSMRNLDSHIILVHDSGILPNSPTVKLERKIAFATLVTPSF